eukprot:12057213-Prorocentrum_lima.AAC.1
MTSSLVGSEMCIRDRTKAAKQNLPATCAESIGARRGGECGNLPDESSDPVSYTHLTLPTICSV